MKKNWILIILVAIVLMGAVAKNKYRWEYIWPISSLTEKTASDSTYLMVIEDTTGTKYRFKMANLPGGKIDTLYVSGDTLYLTEDGILFSAELPAGGSGDGYISSVTESGDSIIYAGPGSAFNGGIGNIAKTNIEQTFTAPSLSTGYTLSLISDNNYGKGLYIKGGASTYSGVAILDVDDRSSNNRFAVWSNGNILMPGLPTGTQDNMLYISGSGYLYKGAAPSGGTTDLTFTGTSSPITLNSSTGTDVTFTAGSGITFTGTSTNMTVSSMWEAYSNGIRPTTSALEMYLGGITDQGSWILQALGNVYIDGSITAENDVSANLFTSNTGFSGGYGNFTGYLSAGNGNFLIAAMSAAPGTTGSSGKPWVKSSDGLFHYETPAGVDYNLITPLSITTATGNTPGSTGHTHDFSSGSASDGQVLTADGSGGVAWESVSGGSSPWSTDTYGIYYNSGNVGIGTSSLSSYSLNLSDGMYSTGLNYTQYLGVNTSPSSSWALKVGGSATVSSSILVGNPTSISLSGAVGRVLANYLTLSERSSLTYDTEGGSFWVNSSDHLPYFTTSINTEYSFDLTSTSDFWKKKDFRPIHNSLEKILSINTYAFNWKSRDEYPDKAPTGNININVRDDNHKRDAAGVIAQEIEKIIPGVVRTMPSTGYKAVDYDALVPYLIEAIKEQQKQIEELKKAKR